MRLSVLTIFPEYLEPLRASLLGRAIAGGRISLDLHDLRDWTTDRHRTVDDAPYGGGPGMVMRPDVWGRALDAVSGPGSVLIVPTPAGRPFTQGVAEELRDAEHLVFACGRYEGIDQRVVVDAARRMPVHELSIGDYVLAGGEAAVLVIVEAVARLLPGVLGNPDSSGQDSFSAALSGLLEAPAYTRPPDYRGLGVPAVLTGGHHAAVKRYRRDESLRRTARHRPDLLAGLPPDALDQRDREVLAEPADPGTVSPPADGSGRLGRLPPSG